MTEANKPTALHAITHKSDAAEVLDYCKSMNPNEVVVFCLFPDGIVIKHSSMISVTQIIGAVERAKYELLATL